MSYVHPFSKRCEKSEVDLFSVPPTQQSLERGRWIDYAPLSSVENPDSAMNFLIAGTDEYIDLSKTILTVEGIITKSNYKDPLSGSPQSSVAPVNNFLHSLFKQVDVYLNGKQVTPAMGTYAYRSYIETLLNYDVSAKESQFSSAMYYKDTAHYMEDTGSLGGEVKKVKIKPVGDDGNEGSSGTVYIITSGTGNQGFAKRSKLVHDGQQFTLSGPIFSDVFMSDRLLLNMMDLKVVLNRSSDTFCLMDLNTSNKVNPRVKLNNVVLKIRKVKVDQAVSDGVERMLKQTPALLTIPANIPHLRKDNIFSGIIPKSFVFGLVDVDAANGTYGKNPYNFAHFGVKNVSLTANGEEIPFKQLVLKYPENSDGNVDPATDKKLDFVEAYNTLFSGTGKIYSNAGLDITLEEYPGGYTLYAFDLTPDMCNSTDYFNTVQRGSLSLALDIGDDKKPLGMVCYGDFENVMRIDSERNVIYDIS